MRRFISPMVCRCSPLKPMSVVTFLQSGICISRRVWRTVTLVKLLLYTNVLLSRQFTINSWWVWTPSHVVAGEIDLQSFNCPHIVLFKGMVSQTLTMSFSRWTWNTTYIRTLIIQFTVLLIGGRSEGFAAVFVILLAIFQLCRYLSVRRSSRCPFLSSSITS